MNDKIAFHPGYYIQELVEDSGLTLEDFSKRLDIPSKLLSSLIQGEEALSEDMAVKISNMTGTSVNLWLNLQKQFDTIVAQTNN